MFGFRTSGEVTFFYNKEKLFDDVGLLSAHMAKSVSSDGAAIDEYSITTDERELFDICVKQTMPNIYEALMKLSSGVSDAFNDDVVVKEDELKDLERNVGTYIEFTINDNTSYNSNVLNMVDTTIDTCLKYGILMEYYATCINAGLQKAAHDKFIVSLEQLKQRLFQLKKRQVIVPIA